MWSLLVVCVLASGPEAGSDVRTASPEVVAELKQSLQTGSLIFSQGDCLAVKIFSASRGMTRLPLARWRGELVSSRSNSVSRVF